MMTKFQYEYLEQQLANLSVALDEAHSLVDPQNSTSDVDLGVLLLIEDMQDILQKIYQVPSP